ncbi:hypothetical protein MUN88_07210 [Gracilibacillus caseinilyticus]|uniref:DUF3953 domain-containing protein n=1 Tax=Gracilibacillus caseinilyticus TaxID=2932256 RepID=A0ABY4EZN4_9BACI|nr:hypothetical protein [Gracilibacillus caseinilyticus]UOQ49854.1 hypothetical protein MUN88_07210 [Gracilibacillus caseinilyticus]
MKRLACVLMLFHLSVSILWLANSPKLFSMLGMIIWLISIVLGFIAYKQIKDKNTTRKLLLYSSSFMVFLLVVTGLIEIAVTSMP